MSHAIGDDSRQIQLNRAMTKLPITVSMISGAEAPRIGRALESVAGWTSEIIVVLNAEVADGTEAVRANSEPVSFPSRGRATWRKRRPRRKRPPRSGFWGWMQTRSSRLNCVRNWRGFSRDQQGARPFAACSFPRLTMFCGRWIRHGDWYPDRTTRLWRKNLAEWGGVDPHARLLVRGEVRKLRGNLLHYNAESIDRQIAKISGFSSDFVRHHQATGQRVTWLDLVLRPAWRFARCYLLRLGFLDGWQG